MNNGGLFAEALIAESETTSESGLLVEGGEGLGLRPLFANSARWSPDEDGLVTVAREIRNYCVFL